MTGQYLDEELKQFGELKPCPFCGGEAEITQRGNEACPSLSATIVCKTQGCKVEMRSGGKPKLGGTLYKCITKAVEKWNRRIQLTEYDHE